MAAAAANRYQAVSPDVHVPPTAPTGHEPNVFLIVSFAEKGLLPPIAPLRDVMG